MKNNKGFTLVEISVVVLILAIITLIVVPAVRTVLSNSKDKAYNLAVTSIEDAAKSYHYNNSNTVEDDITANGYSDVTIETLKEDGFIIGDIENPKDKSNMDGYVRITEPSLNNYDYNFVSN